MSVSSIRYTPVSQPITPHEIRIQVFSIAEQFDSITKSTNLITQQQKDDLNEQTNLLLRQINKCEKNYQQNVKKDSCFYFFDSCNPIGIKTHISAVKNEIGGFIERLNESPERSAESAKKSRKKQCCIALITVGLIVIIVIPIILTQTGS